MDKRTLLKKDQRLEFPGLECVIQAPAGRGSSVLAYTGYYLDGQDEGIRHRVLIRELFPYDPHNMISRTRNGDISIDPSAQSLYERYEQSFLRGNEVHSRMAQEIPADLDLHINTFSFHNTLYSVMGYTGGRSLEEEFKNMHSDKTPASADEIPLEKENGDEHKSVLDLLRILRIIRGALQILETFHETGYLHLDISPDNILLIGDKERERITLIDYNSVHTIEEIRNSSSFFFSLKDGYTAPEVRLGNREKVGRHSDLYSMTAVFWHCLSGNKLTELQQIGSVRPDPNTLPRWKDLAQTALSMLRRIINRGLSPAPGRRYQDVGEMLADIDELEERLLGRGITRWALWENGRERYMRLMRSNVSLQYIRDDQKVYPLRAETQEGVRADLFDLLQTGDRCPENTDSLFLKNHALLLLGGGGTGKSTALLRFCRKAYTQMREYREQEAAVFYISLYGYRDKNHHFLTDTLLEGMRFKPETDGMESARRELLELLDRPGAPVLYLLLDGFNEASGDTAPLLDEIRMLSEKKGVRIIMSSRSDPGILLFTKLSLCRLDPSDIRGILSKEGILRPENMEVFDLLGFPLLLSIYIESVKSGETNPGLLQNREQLLDAYFTAVCKKEIADLPENADKAAGLDAVFRYLLPEIAAGIHESGRPAADSELMEIVERCYGSLSGKALTRVHPEWIGRTKALRLGAQNVDEWYGKAVLEILYRHTGLLVRDEQGRFRILHQIMEDWLTEKSRQFHLLFDREEKRRRLTRNAAAASVIFILVFVFGIYNYWMRRQIEKKQEELVRSETEMLILEYVQFSGNSLSEGDRKEAVRTALDAVLLSYADQEQAEMVYFEEDGLELLREELPLIRERIDAGQEISTDTYYSSRAQKALTEALGVYDYHEDTPAGNGSESGEDASAGKGSETGEDTSTGNGSESGKDSPSGNGLESGEDASAGKGLESGKGLDADTAVFLRYDPSYSHTDAGVNVDGSRVMLYSTEGFCIYDVQSGKILCEQELPDYENIIHMQFVRDAGKSFLEVTWADGTRRSYDADDGNMSSEMTDPAGAPSLKQEYLTDDFRLVTAPGEPIIIYDRETGEDQGEFVADADVSNITQYKDMIIIEYRNSDINTSENDTESDQSGNGTESDRSGTDAEIDQSETDDESNQSGNDTESDNSGTESVLDGSEPDDHFAFILNEYFETLAYLTYSCDVLDGMLYFDCPGGTLRSCPVYTAADLLDLAAQEEYD